MKILKFGVVLLCLTALFSCSDNDSGDQDDQLDMSKVVNKYLYYNKWLNNKDSYSKEGLVEMIRFDNNGGSNFDGKVWQVDFGGKTETFLAKWKEQNGENQLTLTYDGGKEEIWHILECNPNGTFTVMVNSGKREYISEDDSRSDYLHDLTGDAFILTEVEMTEVVSTLRIVIEGGKSVNVKKANAILSDDQIMALKYQNKSLTESEAIDATSLGLPGRERDVIFYVNMGNGKEFKFSDHIYNNGLGMKTFADFNLDAINLENNSLKVSWNPYSDDNAYYQVEIFNDKMNLENPYFVSDLLSPGTSSLTIDNTTKCLEGYTNNMNKLNTRGQQYVVRLSAVLLEPGTDVNSKYSYVNKQAVTHVKRLLVWN